MLLSEAEVIKLASERKISIKENGSDIIVFWKNEQAFGVTPKTTVIFNGEDGDSKEFMCVVQVRYGKTLYSCYYILSSYDEETKLMDLAKDLDIHNRLKKSRTPSGKRIPKKKILPDFDCDEGIHPSAAERNPDSHDSVIEPQGKRKNKTNDHPAEKNTKSSMPKKQKTTQKANDDEKLRSIALNAEALHLLQKNRERGMSSQKLKTQRESLSLTQSESEDESIVSPSISRASPQKKTVTPHRQSPLIRMTDTEFEEEQEASSTIRRVSPRKKSKTNGKSQSDRETEDEAEQTKTVRDPSSLDRSVSPRKKSKTNGKSQSDRETEDEEEQTKTVRDPSSLDRRVSPRKKSKTNGKSQSDRETEDEAEQTKTVRDPSSLDRSVSPRKKSKTNGKSQSDRETEDEEEQTKTVRDPSSLDRRVSPRKKSKTNGKSQSDRHDSETEDEAEHTKTVKDPSSTDRRVSPRKKSKTTGKSQSDRETEDKADLTKIASKLPPKKRLYIKSPTSNHGNCENSGNSEKITPKRYSMSKFQSDTEEDLLSKASSQKKTVTPHRQSPLIRMSDTESEEEQEASSTIRKSHSQPKDQEADSEEQEAFEWIKENMQKMASKVKSFADSQKRIEKLEEEVKKLKKKFQSMKHEPEIVENEVILYNTKNSADIKKVISNKSDFQSCVKDVFLFIFGEDYLIHHSIKGRKANAKHEVKPALDRLTYDFLTITILEKFPDKCEKDIIAKLQNVQKAIRLKKTSANK
ncbi:micronuclear linker histone polyprotein-like [Mytilus edulis]|uniref:micronuclear linker histone polyprotein-like n=1 Tax=Mytilus edulis TaxID=6550 RepID=UPI0039F09302